MVWSDDEICGIRRLDGVVYVFVCSRINAHCMWKHWASPGPIVIGLM